MAATVTTQEKFDKSTSEKRLQKEIELRIKAGAIRSNFTKEDDTWVLTTEWNVIGEQ